MKLLKNSLITYRLQLLLAILVLALLMLVLTIWMMRGKRVKVMKTRAQLLITKN